MLIELMHGGGGGGQNRDQDGSPGIGHMIAVGAGTSWICPCARSMRTRSMRSCRLIFEHRRRCPASDAASPWYSSACKSRFGRRAVPHQQPHQTLQKIDLPEGDVVGPLALIAGRVVTGRIALKQLLVNRVQLAAENRSARPPNRSPVGGSSASGLARSPRSTRSSPVFEARARLHRADRAHQTFPDPSFFGYLPRLFLFVHRPVAQIALP
jgi:hypothetical protein